MMRRDLNREDDVPAFQSPCTEEWYNEILDNMSDAVIAVDTEMTVVAYNYAAQLLSGVSRDEALGMKCHEIFATPLCGAGCPVREIWRRERSVVTREVLMQDCQGATVPVLIKASPLFNKEGVLVGGVKSMRCLRRLYSIIDSVADGLFTVNERMQITNFNRAAEELTGIAHQDALGRPCSEVFKTTSCQQNCPIREAVATVQTVQRDLELTDCRGGKRLIAASASILYDCSGKAIGGVETLRDLTPIVDMREEIREKYTFRRLVSRNSAMRKLFAVMEDVGASDATVLLYGESGTGKELFAHALHDLSRRRNGPLVTVNCGALPETLLESEIFGVRKGAFTGAAENRPGRIEQCQGGTFFLDEIGDLPLTLQVKLLRLLENKEFQPLGGRSPVKADVRFVAASHRNLAEMVRQGSFRQDLFFRLNIVTLQIPPLRERVDDIPLLVEMALQRFNLAYGKRIRTVAAEVMQQFFTYPFPGNVRELLNIMEQASIMCHGSEITMEQLPGAFRTPPRGGTVPHRVAAAMAGSSRSGATPETIMALLERFKGNRNAVAHELGVDRTTLWRWMNRHGLSVSATGTAQWATGVSGGAPA